MKSFEEQPTCIKCGHNILSVKYMPSDSLFGHKLRDHLKIICLRCGYMDLMITKDSPGTKQGPYDSHE